MRKITKYDFFFLPFILYLIYLANYFVVIPFIEKNFDLFLSRMDKVLNKPFSAAYWTKTTPMVLIISCVSYIIILYLYRMMKRDYRVGEEYGTSRWANIKETARELMDRKSPDLNLLLTKNFSLSIDPDKTGLNKNILAIGGSGAGKTFRLVGPNLMQCNTSFIVTDPKGGCPEIYAKMLKKNGYQVKVLDLIDMNNSDCYDPFEYLRTNDDVTKLVTNIMANTTPENAQKSDPFWDDAVSLFLQSLFFYTWKVSPEEGKPANMNTFLELVSEADADEDTESLLDLRFERLRERDPKHIALKTYDKFMSGANETLRSIIISSHAKLFRFETEGLQGIFQRDDMDLASLGMGKLKRGKRDKKTKTALFIVIPDDDTSLNFVAGMLYTQMFQELYYQAKHCPGNKLPIPVQIWFDEFANIAMPESFKTIISTLRSRNMGAVIILQALSQLKSKYKDNWETIVGSCDTILFLGGNEPGTHKYISEQLGKQTLYKKSSSTSKGRNGSFSQTEDVYGRDLMDPAEVRMMRNSKCICMIRGQYPIIDNKIDTLNHGRVKETALYGMPKSLLWWNDKKHQLNDIFERHNINFRFTKFALYSNAPYVHQRAYHGITLIDESEMSKRVKDGDTVIPLTYSMIKELLKKDTNYEDQLKKFEVERKKMFKDFGEKEKKEEAEAKIKRLPAKYEKMSLEELILAMELKESYIEVIVQALENHLPEQKVRSYITDFLSEEEIAKRIKIYKISQLKKEARRYLDRPDSNRDDKHKNSFEDLGAPRVNVIKDSEEIETDTCEEFNLAEIYEEDFEENFE